MDNDGIPGMAHAPANFCNLNTICVAAAQIGSQLADLPCDEHSPAVSEGIVVKLTPAPNGHCPQCGKKLYEETGFRNVSVCPGCGNLYSLVMDGPPQWIVSERGMAEFVGRQIGHSWAQPAGDVFHLGPVSGQDLYFAAKPPLQFFNAHNENSTSIVIGNSRAKIPGNWNGHVAYFNELFYYKKKSNKFDIAPNILKRILPRAGSGLKRGKYRVIHERRDYWLRFLVSLFAKPYDPKDFFNGVIRRSVVCSWFKRNIPGAPTNPKTYKRDYDSFRTYCGKKGEYDYRESMIVLLLKQAADPTFKDRLKTAKAITDLLVQLKEGESKLGRPIEIAECKWQYTGDKRGTRTLVPTTPALVPELEF